MDKVTMGHWEKSQGNDQVAKLNYRQRESEKSIYVWNPLCQVKGIDDSVHKLELRKDSIISS